MKGTPPLILIVDDDADLRRMLRHSLAHEGFVTAEAGDGGEGFQMAAELLPAAILLDRAMPLMDGWTCAEKLRNDPRTKHIPIIALTSHSDQDNRNQSMRVGVAGFVPKPFDVEHMVEEIRRALNIKRPPGR